MQRNIRYFAGPRMLDKRYLNKLDPGQQEMIWTGPGRRFYEEFVSQKGYHAYIIGNTGSGKTQKGYYLVSWLRHTENQIWISTGKNDEILPLLCFGCPVRIIVPTGCDIRIEEKGELIPNHPEVIKVESAGEAWHKAKKRWDKNRHELPVINIFDFRNFFWSTNARSEWMSDLFETLATWTRLGKMPHIFPFSLYVDEAQWVLAGTRVSTDKSRVKTSEIVTENAMEIRGAGGRLIFFAQDYKNITPASRENMLVTILCRGSIVDRDENPRLAQHCFGKQGRLPSTFKPWEGKIVYSDGESSPSFKPWRFPLFPLDENDRKWIAGLKVKYEGFHDLQSESEDEKFPIAFPSIDNRISQEVGRFAETSIPPDKETGPTNRWGIMEGLIDGY